MKASSYNWMASRLLVSIILTVTPLIAVAEAKINVQRQYTFNLPRQSVAESLNDLAKQTGEQFLFPYQLAESKAAKPVTGHFTLFEATQILLRDTGLTSDLVDGVLIISLMDDIGASSYQNHKGKSMNSNKRKNLLATMIGLFAAGGVVQQAYGQGVDSATAQSQINEVFVTADKREAKSLQDTPMAISAVGGEMIDKKNLVSMDDYLRNIPGVSMQERGAGQNSIVIRGMATDPQDGDPTTAAYFGEVPTSNLRTAALLGSTGNADLKLIDIERVEVLRGPQGTLYGSGSVSGTVRTIPNAPRLDGVEGNIATRLSNTADAGGDNTTVQAVLNMPLIEDKLAVRGVAYRIDNSGYVDNVAGSQPTDQIADLVASDAAGAVAVDKGDRGSSETTGFRLAALWQLTEQFDATLTYITQETEQDGLPEVNLDAEGKYQQQRLQLGSGQNENELLETDLEIVNLVLKYDLGWAELNSSSSWLDNKSRIQNDLSTWIICCIVDDDPVPVYLGNNNATVDVFVEELRLSSLGDGPVQWVTGLYYEDKETQFDTVLSWNGDPALDPESPSVLDRASTLEQKAVFGELTYAFSEQWEATLGARYFDYEAEEVATFRLAQATAPSYVDRSLATDETGQTYKGVLSYIPNEDLLIYGQFAQGFRLGRPQLQGASCSAMNIDVPGIDSDRSETFELGMKSSWNEGRINLNAAIYRTDWDDIPVRVRTTFDGLVFCSRQLNAGKALSEGVEIELQARLTDHLQLDISASTVDATLEETSSIGNKGDDLPGSADYNASIGLEYGFTLLNNPGFARLDYAYVGEYYNDVQKTGTPAGDFGQMHAKVGTTIGQVDIDLFASNLTNEDGLTWVENTLVRFSGNEGYEPNRRGYRIRPRTVGINLSYNF